MASSFASPAEKAAQVWQHFVGMFGAPAVERMYGPKVPIEWQAMVGALNDYELARGFRRLGHSGLRMVPSLPQFLKLCREVGGENDGDTPPSRVPALPSPRAFDGDKWDIAANLKLLRHVTGRAQRCAIYSRPECMAHLLAAKRTWAGDMRELEGEGALPKDGDDSLWDDAMRNAESAINFELQERAA